MRILYVDDEAPVRSAFQRLLRGTHDVDIAAGADAAVALVEQHRYSVILADYHMPVMDGLSLIAKLKPLQPDAAYILISGDYDDARVQLAESERTVRCVLKKPWKYDDLLKTLSTLT